ncbi:hypothetical protein GQ53DRAFT_751457 [Thozetella sp. PMI_491]|nr:hypothetical protein GQ53DRAFT_751457 [Thozetella sp. PMI_491]
MAPPGLNPPTTVDDDEEDDYMSMAFIEAPAQPETSLQRRKRLEREGEQRSRQKSKAELAAQEESLREAALSRSLFDAPAPGKPKSKGLAMMAKMGFTGGALGAADNESARAEPLRVTQRDGREGIGVESERKRKLREAVEATAAAAKKAKVDEGDYRERVRREREEARHERQVHAAQKVAERMDEEKAEGAAGSKGEQDDEGADGAAEGGKAKMPRGISSRPLKSIPVVYRGLVRGREEAERDRRMRHDLEQSLSRLPTYVDEDEDADDRKALGKSTTVYVTSEDLDEEDEELDGFNALDAEEKLRRLVEYLRKEHRYCFWCKFAYSDEALEGCPGPTEEDHD